jgi:hypothetical protein
MLCTIGALAIDLDVTPEDVDRALAIGRHGETSVDTFHTPYVRTLEQTTDTITVKHVEVLTIYRRIVLHAEGRRRLGDTIVSRADIEPILREWRNRVGVVATVRFHPQNVLTSLPPIEVAVRDPVLESNIEPLDVSRAPIASSGKSRPLLGSTIETVFDAGLLANMNGVVVVALRGKELARTTIDFRTVD